MDVPDMESLVDNFQYELGYFQSMFIHREFENKVTLKEIFSFLWDLETAQKCLVPTQVFSEKSATSSNRLRSVGNNYYKQKQYKKALQYYNLSILAAPHPVFNSASVSEAGVTDKDFTNGTGVNGSVNDDQCCEDFEKYKSLSWGYSNRSAVLLVLKRYQECLRDVELALKYGDPELLETNLHERKQKCLDALKKAHSKTNQPRSPVPPAVSNSNPSIPALSNAVKLAFTPAKGRYLVATRNIRPGELLGVEESFSHSLDSECLQSYCCVCLMECEAPLPCPTCTMIIYCSNSCRTKGQQEHWLECHVLPSLLALEPEASKLILAFKMLSQTPYTSLKKIMPQLEKEAENCPKIRQGFDANGIYSKGNYTAVYHLVSNHDGRTSEELYANCIVAVVLNKLLQINGKYFMDEEGKEFTPSREDLLLTGEALFRHILQSQCNYHPLVCTKTGEFSVETTSLGLGLFPTMSLMNHSCHPSTVNYNNGSTLVLRSIRSIRAGEEITESYCGKFYSKPIFMRRLVLQQGFQMICYCEACENQWPVLRSLPELRVKCTSCQRPVRLEFPKCPVCVIDYRNSNYMGNKKDYVQRWCYAMQQLKGAEEKFSSVLNKTKLQQTLTDQDCSDVCRFIELLENNVQLPCATYCRALAVFESLLRLKAVQDLNRQKH